MSDDKFVWIVVVDKGMILSLPAIHSAHISQDSAEKECYKVYALTPRDKPRVIKIPLRD